MPHNIKTPEVISRISGNVLLRNVILAVCGIVVFVFLCSVLLNFFTRHNRYKTVPDFTGRVLSEIRRDARRADLRIEVIDSVYVPAYPGGTILDQNPVGGAEVKAGRRIFLTTNAYHQRMVEIPYVTGFSLRQAKNSLEVAGLEIEKLTYRADLASNYVLEERFGDRLITPSSEETAPQGSGITLVVGMGEGVTTAKVPKLVGFPLKEAKSRLWEMGLNVGKITEDEGITPMNISEARVVSQSPEQGVNAMLGRAVDFTLTLDTEKVEQGSQRSNRSARRIISTQQQAENDTIRQQ
jgi:beta-lactam-binding protein with PASTA domain